MKSSVDCDIRMALDNVSSQMLRNYTLVVG